LALLLVFLCFASSANADGRTANADLNTKIGECSSGITASCAAVANYDTSSIADLSHMFHSSPFNGDISGWDVSSVTNMQEMFHSSSFNGDISGWDVSSVTSMDSMFYNSVFNNDLCPWDLENRPSVLQTNMFVGSALEAFASTGGCPLCPIVKPWGSPCLQNNNEDCTAALRCLVRGCCAGGAWVCGDEVSGWDVSSVPSAIGLFSLAGGFECAHVFDGNLSGWDVSSMTNMDRMFEGNLVFNGDLSHWGVGQVRSAKWMFMGAVSFNGDLSAWDTGLLESAHRMFTKWSTGNVRDTSLMFMGATVFNGDISKWDASSLTGMGYMFFGASSFRGSLCAWDLASGSVNITQAFAGTQLSARDIYACPPPYACPAGNEFDGSGGCIACPAGTYKATSGTHWCERCWEGSITRSALGPCVYECACQPGYYLQGGLCAACPENTYKASYGDDEPCAVCGEGQFSGPGAVSCDCVPGTFVV